jgi:pimeloyl-ACP methyl ester carboxylesterase
MIDAAHRVSVPLFLIQSANDYSIRPTREIAAALEGTGKVVQSRIYGDFGITRDEGHFLFRDGPVLWWPEVRDFLDRWL